ncbi:hypothetical protein EOE67_19525 [Rheinheimera riviphila]|uniref:Uncharacterized protein n=1 Tax=Rheinheimera riviphila TaxID=1834037 RepID=A0A437QBJ1_9GAMM|nr:hypothetical protein [Rheinheimera riviphila]RVU31920.1 hypothetical protein EOE67_19525 [Rheinheimera riviphila]
MTYRISRFVSKFDFEVSRDDNVPWHYVIEIYESEHTFFPRVFRWESFLITPTETDLEICEEKMLVKDEFFDWDSIVGENEIFIKNSVIVAIKEKMGLE